MLLLKIDKPTLKLMPKYCCNKCRVSRIPLSFHCFLYLAHLFFGTRFRYLPCLYEWYLANKCNEHSNILNNYRSLTASVILFDIKYKSFPRCTEHYPTFVSCVCFHTLTMKLYTRDFSPCDMLTLDLLKPERCSVSKI